MTSKPLDQSRHCAAPRPRRCHRRTRGPAREGGDGKQGRHNSPGQGLPHGPRTMWPGSVLPPTTAASPPPPHRHSTLGAAPERPGPPRSAPDPRERLLLPQPAVPTAVPMPALGRGRHSCLPAPRTHCPHAVVRGSVCHPGEDTCRHRPLSPWWLPWGSWGPGEVWAQPSTLSPMAGLGAIHPPTHGCPVTGEV